MKTNIRLRTKRALVVLAALVLGSGAVLLGVGQGYAFNPQPDSPGRIARLGLLTLARTQVLRLYAVNLAIGNPDVIPKARCAVRLGFSDINGTPVFGNPPEPDFELRPGVGAFIELDAGGISDPDERPVRAEAFLIGNPDVKNCQIVISAQVIDKLTGVGSSRIPMSLTSSAAKTCARSKVFAAPSVFSDRVRLAHGLSISFASH